MAESKGLMVESYMTSRGSLLKSAERLTQLGQTKGPAVEELDSALNRLEETRQYLKLTFDLDLPSPWPQGRGRPS